MRRPRVAVLASGSGSNLQALLDAELGGELCLVICNVPGAKALARAQARGVRALLIDHKAFADRAAFDQALLAALLAAQVDWVVLAGFMRILTRTVLGAFPDRVVNIHPALLPAFPGVHAQRQALEAGVKFTGCTVHLVDEGTDTGPILAQAVVPVLPGDDEAALAARILAEEHRLYPRVVRALLEGRLVKDGRQTRLVGAEDERPRALSSLLGER